jgi:hypothetical protein
MCPSMRNHGPRASRIYDTPGLVPNVEEQLIRPPPSFRSAVKSAAGCVASVLVCLSLWCLSAFVVDDSKLHIREASLGSMITASDSVAVHALGDPIWYVVICASILAIFLLAAIPAYLCCLKNKRVREEGALEGERMPLMGLNNDAPV